MAEKAIQELEEELVKLSAGKNEIGVIVLAMAIYSYSGVLVNTTLQNISVLRF